MLRCFPDMLILNVAMMLLKTMIAKWMSRSEVLRFIFTGGFATLLHYLIYFLLLQLRVNMTVAFGIGYFLSFLLIM